MAFTWERPAWARVCYIVATLAGIDAAYTDAPTSLSEVVPRVLAGVAVVLAVMSYLDPD